MATAMDEESCSICLEALTVAPTCSTVVQDSAGLVANPLVAAASSVPNAASNSAATGSSSTKDSPPLTTSLSAFTSTTPTPTCTNSTTTASSSSSNSTDSFLFLDPATTKNLYIANLDSCDHVFHHSCIMPWTNIANSCPMCRVEFHKIHVSTPPPNQKLIKTYRVEDKKQPVQVDNLDTSISIELEDAHPCPICLSDEDESVLLLCDGPNCRAAYHTYCIGLEEVPTGDWLCMECAHLHSQGLIAAPSDAPNPALDGARPPPRRRAMRTRLGLRNISRVIRNIQPESSAHWNRLVNHVYESTNIDLNTGDDVIEIDMLRERRSAIRSRIETERTREVSRSTRVVPRRPARPPLPISSRVATPSPQPSVPEPMSQDVVDAWGALDEALGTGNSGESSTGNPRTVASSSNTNTSSAPPHRRKRPAPQQNAPPSSGPEPPTERKQKRPCTRPPPKVAEPASSSAAASGPSARANALAPSTSAAASPAEDRPSFVSSLLKEVGLEPSTDDEKVGHYLRRGTCDLAISPVGSPDRSRGSSPTSGCQSPPFMMNKSGSPGLTSHIEPDYSSVNQMFNDSQRRGRDGEAKDRRVRESEKRDKEKETGRRSSAAVPSMHARSRVPAWLRDAPEEAQLVSEPTWVSKAMASASPPPSSSTANNSSAQSTSSSSSSSSSSASSTGPFGFRENEVTASKRKIFEAMKALAFPPHIYNREPDEITSAIQQSLRRHMTVGSTLTSGQFGQIGAQALATVRQQLRSVNTDDAGFPDKLVQLATVEVQRRINEATVETSTKSSATSSGDA
ncbi:hypothetical protein BROUX41_004245 [Berkeleyomyces rouxiae]